MHIDYFLETIDKTVAYVDLYVEECEKLDASDKTAVEEKRIIFYANLKSNAIELYRHLNVSVLEAEYITKDSVLNDLANAITRLESCHESFADSESFLMESNKLFRYVSFFKYDITSYIHQIQLYEKSITEPQKFQISYNSSVNKSNKVYDELELKNLSKVFELNLDLMLHDRELSLRNYSFFNINDIYCELKGIKEKNLKEPYVDALLHKCRILETKFYYRDEIGGLLDAYNFYDGKFEDLDLNVDEIGFVSKKLRKINTRDKKKYEQNITDYFRRFETPKTSFEFFIACHFFKNVAIDEKSLKDLIDIYGENMLKDTASLSRVDVHRRYVNHSYLKNCLFSFLLKNSDAIMPSDVEQLLKNAISGQNQAGIGNHFCYYKTATWYKEYLEKCIEKRNISIECRGYLGKLDKNITEAEKKLLERSRDATSFIPFMPEISECYEEFTPENSQEPIKIFISTSYIVPVDYSKAIKQVKELREAYIRLSAVVEASLFTSSNLQKVLDSEKDIKNAISMQETKTDDTIKKVDEKLKLELSDNLKNSIQILSIFSAIVVFASGTIQIFTGATSIKDAAIFMVMFASALGLIALFVRNCFISRGQWNSRDWAYLVAMVTIVALTAIGVFADWGNQVVNQKGTNIEKAQEIVLKVDASDFLDEELVEEKNNKKSSTAKVDLKD